MKLKHDFSVISKTSNSNAEKNAENYATVDDTLILYIWDSLQWVNTFNPSKKENGRGLFYHGQTIINDNSLILLKEIVGKWIELFSLGPDIIYLTGEYIIDPDENFGKYEKHLYYRVNIVEQLESLKKIILSAIKLKSAVLHEGI